MDYLDVKLGAFSNIGVHLINPLLMLCDRILFYRNHTMEKRHVVSLLLFPCFYIIQAFSLGATRAVWFAPIGVNAYYVYPFLNLDVLGWLVFPIMIALAMAMLGLGYVFYYLEKFLFRQKKQPQ